MTHFLLLTCVAFKICPINEQEGKMNEAPNWSCFNCPRGEKMDLGWCPIVLSVCWPSAEGGNGVRQLSIYIEVNNRDDSVENNWDDNQFDRRISTRGFSGEGRRRTAWWAVGSSNHKEFILMFGAILRRLFTVSLSVVCITGQTHSHTLIHKTTKSLCVEQTGLWDTG